VQYQRQSTLGMSWCHSGRPPPLATGLRAWGSCYTFGVVEGTTLGDVPGVELARTRGQAGRSTREKSLVPHLAMEPQNRRRRPTVSQADQNQA
jgi:hypothetical protein